MNGSECPINPIHPINPMIIISRSLLACSLAPSTPFIP